MNPLNTIPELLSVALVLMLAYVLLCKTALSRLWWPVVRPVLQPLGFMLVTKDMSFGIYGIEWHSRYAFWTDE
jgi:hypothetical protein